MRILLSNCASIDLATDNGATPLFLAAQNNHPEVASFWVAHEAQLDLVDDQGANALHAAAFNDRPEVCAILIAAGLDPAAQMPHGWTALSHYGLFLDDNDPDAHDAVPPAGEEGPELGARCGPLMHALIGSSLRLTAAQQAEHF